MTTQRNQPGKLAPRVATTVTATGVLLLTAVGVASAHVTVHSPDNLSKGSTGEIVFRVPNEEDTAHATKVRVNFSTTSPITNAGIRPVPGWTAQETMMTLPKPVDIDNETVTTAVKSITWSAATGGGIAPGEFQEFPIVVEGLPDNTGTLIMPAVQTYDNGDIVNWDQPSVAGQPEPEHPAPHLVLAASRDSGTAAAANTTSAAPPAASSSDGTARLLGIIGIVIAALGLGFGLGAFARRGRTGGGGSTTHLSAKQGASA